jgi:hypothetical protein
MQYPNTFQNLSQNQQICTSPIFILLYIYVCVMWLWHFNFIELTWSEHQDFTLVPERRKWLEWKGKFHLLGTTAWQVVAAALEYGDVLSLGPCRQVSWEYGESWPLHFQWCLTLQSNTRILHFLMCKSRTNFYRPIGSRYHNNWTFSFSGNINGHWCYVSYCGYSFLSWLIISILICWQFLYELYSQKL